VKNSTEHLGSVGGREVKRVRDLESGGPDLLLDYRPVSDLNIGTVIGNARQQVPDGAGGVQTVAGAPLVVVGPPPVDGVWNLSDGSTLDANSISHYLAGELTPAEAVALIGELPP